VSGLPNLDLAGMQAWARSVMERAPDFVIGDPANPYMRRWFIVPRNELCNVYLHEILRSDDDRAGHDHPWPNHSYLIEGVYDEAIYYTDTPWQLAHTLRRLPGSHVHREATDCHRLMIPEGGRAVSLFTTGPRVRDWGFWCANPPRWVHWEKFTTGPNGALVGAGCGETGDGVAAA